MDCTIRQYAERDFAALCDFERALSPRECKPAVFIRQSGVLFPDTFFVAEKNGAIVGYSIGAFVQRAPARAWIIRLGVREAERRQGVGEYLLKTVIAALCTAGAREVLLSVSPDNRPARNLYEKHGFVAIGRHDAYFEEGEDRLIMQKTFPPA
ncbi:MAG: GNAT family N-acetyltransferase [Methanomicrobiaceae archaeon]|nr:GNAT family N-acetyltransferase [Methanomicrobiaceae archaeon]MDD5419330.1 GNAT family N-acetyltransferase [Methanomicrobiaceae archaeon]